MTFEVDHDEMVMVRDIPLYSLCEHHLLPFIGTRPRAPTSPRPTAASPGCRSWPVWSTATRSGPQVQERLTPQIAEAMVDMLQPQGVLVVIEAEHLCMSMRGVRKPGATTVTSAVHGTFRDETSTKLEAMRFLER